MEIFDIMESFRRRERENRKWKIMHDFIMAEVQSRFLFTKKGKPAPRPWDYYPALFEEDRVQFEKEESEAEFEDYKSRRRARMEAFNVRFAGQQ